MFDFFRNLLDTSDFPARWYCGNWSDSLGWLHIGSDLAIWAAYFAIPVVLLYFARRRDDLPLRRIFFLFAAFIVACGTTHLIEAVIFWQPVYRLSGLVKLITAVVSWATVIALIKNVPKVLHYPSLDANNQRLQTEVDQRIKSEAELKAATARYEALLSGTRSIVWSTNTNGEFVTPQISWERYTGQTFDQHRGSGWSLAIAEQDRERIGQEWHQARANRSIFQATGRIWHQASGKHREYFAEAVPVLDGNGEIIEWVGTITDTEDQRQARIDLDVAQSEIAQQKRELELIYQSAPVGMSLIDRDYKFLRVNQTLAKINGIPRDQHIGRRADELLVSLKDKIKPLYERVFETGEPMLDVEIVGTTLAGDDERTWLVSYYPLELDNNGSNRGSRVTAVSAIVLDITERKQQEQRLIESERVALAANQSKSEFLANMSHEIRTPMAAILGYADVLLGHLKDPDNRNCVLIVKKNGQYLLELINDILDLSRIEANKMDVDLSDVSMVRLVADIRSLMSVRASEKGLALNVEFATEVPQSIRTDATRLRQVLINLIGNAIKFTGEGSVTLRITMHEQPSPMIEFSVTDTGIGIGEEQLTRLFKPFSQGDTSVTRKFGGSGLGLAISDRLVNMLGGTIAVQSAVGSGSTFSVRLPIDADEAATRVRPVLDDHTEDTQNVTRPPRQLSCRVLVVDDRRDVRHISQHFLEKAGAIVVMAEDGRQGIDVALASRQSGEPFDLIVMDMQMPKVDGLQATAELRSAGVNWPIIALTADAMMGDRERCLDGGCDDYLSKPIDHAELIEMVGWYTQDITPDQLIQRRRDHSQQLKRRLEM